ncbi:Hypothetical predicted protein [Marmota monax]|uniref:Uncharacterized protein n=1 Tax=Marmota monax TaxID=9995 RepID=A0A5E4A760_MARMO|nr:hypothetical protein GHT09_012924 [Marmota monax]VTJ52825.1 Hypothetical predicted protein [Marmota monax]
MEPQTPWPACSQQDTCCHCGMQQPALSQTSTADLLRSTQGQTALFLRGGSSDTGAELSLGHQWEQGTSSALTSRKRFSLFPENTRLDESELERRVKSPLSFPSPLSPGGKGHFLFHL